MYFEDFASLINMDGHGIYVWFCYGIGLLVIAYNIISPLMARRRVVAQIKRQARSALRSNKSQLNFNSKSKSQHNMSRSKQKETLAHLNSVQAVSEGGVE